MENSGRPILSLAPADELSLSKYNILLRFAIIHL